MKQRISCVLLAIALIASSMGCNQIKKLKEIPIDLSKVNEDFTLQELKDLNGGYVELYYDEIYGNLSTIHGKFSTRKITNEEDAVYALMSIRSLMDIEDTSFACIRKTYMGIRTTYVLQQMYKGIAVFEGKFTIDVSEEEGPGKGVPTYVSGRYRPNVELDINPKISVEQAKKAVVLQCSTTIGESQLVVYDGTSGYVLAWMFYVAARDSLDEKDVYVDATTGNVLDSYPRAIS